MDGSSRTIDVATVIGDRRLSAFNYKLIILSWLITVFDGFDMSVISYTAPYMRDQLHLSTMMLGDIFSAGLVGMMIGSFCFSWLADRIGRRPAVIGAAFLFGLLTMATGLARDYHQVLALRLVDGIAIGGMLPIAWALNIEFVPTRMRASVVTVIMLGYSFGGAISGPLTNLIAPHHGWQGVYFVGGAATLVCAALLLLWLPESVRFLVSKGLRPALVARTLNRLEPGIAATPADRFMLSDEEKVKRDFHVRQLFEGDLKYITPLLWLGYAVSSLTMYFAASWGPMVLEALDINRHTAANVSSIGGVAGALAGLSVMRFTDRLGPASIAVYPAFAVPVLLLMGFGLVPSGAFLIFVVASALLLGGEHFGILSIMGVFYPSAIRASGVGWGTSIAKAAAILGPLFGAVVLSGGIPILRSYALLAVCPAILCLCTLGIGAVVRGRRPEADAIGAVPAE